MTTRSSTLTAAQCSLSEATAEIISAGQFLAAKGWAPATSGNYSMRLSDQTMLMSVSGRDKGCLTPQDLMPLTMQGETLTLDETRTPSAETLLHVGIYHRYAEARAILHTHSIHSVVLSRHVSPDDKILLSGYEILKALPGITTHETTVVLPIFENSQDMAQLARQVDAYFSQQQLPSGGYLIRGHGLYAWGRSMPEARAVLEALEFCFSCELATLSLGRAMETCKP
ncbi:MAG: methylthioribulose 1-phosphate dehydratase [Vampirovibrionales bacterium]|nr:methylthioribulose 1-phosphate dehydratase [Vampirovibrionales bacterium]